jgi:hypothetical protein
VASRSHDIVSKLQLEMAAKMRDLLDLYRLYRRNLSVR